jgi:hypothetical protein
MCYRFETLQFDNALFSKEVVDAAYILTMESSQRAYRGNFAKARPTATVHIQYNKGFNACEKENLCEKQSHYDISHAVNNAFQDAKRRGYRRILCLEDDFFFSETITGRDVQRISSFLQSNDHVDCYTLGCMPTFAMPSASSLFHLRIGQFTGAHAMIFSRHMMDDYMQAYASDPCSIGHVDMYYWVAYRCYGYYKPLVYQVFPATDNKENWPWYGRLLMKCMPTLGEKAEPWYGICYTISLFPSILMALLAVYFAKRLIQTATLEDRP